MSNNYPFNESTLGKKLEAGTGLLVYGGTCKRTAVLNVAELGPRRSEPAFYKSCGNARAASQLVSASSH